MIGDPLHDDERHRTEPGFCRGCAGRRAGSVQELRQLDQGRARLNKNGLLVITSYFDHEHKLALAALQAMGMEVVESRRNKASRALKDAPGKSVDRWVAVLRPKK